LMLGWNMGLEIIAFHPNSGGTFAGTSLGDESWRCVTPGDSP
jgi:hypothetical protein